MKPIVFSSYQELELKLTPQQSERFCGDDSSALKPLRQPSLMFFHFVPLLNSFVIIDLSQKLRYINKRNTRAKALANARSDEKLVSIKDVFSTKSLERPLFFLSAIPIRPIDTAIFSSHFIASITFLFRSRIILKLLCWRASCAKMRHKYRKTAEKK